jgi:hypothetical protein
MLFLIELFTSNHASIILLEITVVIEMDDIWETIGYSSLEDFTQDFSDLLFDCSLDSSLDILFRIFDSLATAAVVFKSKKVTSAYSLTVSAL